MQNSQNFVISNSHGKTTKSSMCSVFECTNVESVCRSEITLIVILITILIVILIIILIVILITILIVILIAILTVIVIAILTVTVILINSCQ